MDHKCPNCKVEFSHVPDCVNFHYECAKCGKEFELDAKTEWENYGKH